MHSSFFDFQLKDVINLLVLTITIWAIIYGPISAFKISKIYSKSEEKRTRQHQIFYILMKTRKMLLTPERIGALNTVQLDFYGVPVVLDAYRKYVDHLDTALPQTVDDHKKFFEKREDIFYDLLYEIGKYLDFSFDRREMQKLAYLPEGWNTDDQEARIFRRYAVELLSGRRGLPIEKFRVSKTNKKFPPPP